MSFAAADFAAAIQMSIDETQQQATINVPPGSISASSARLDSGHSRDARVSPAAMELPSIKSIHELKEHLSIGSLFRMKRDWLTRLVTLLANLDCACIYSTLKTFS